MPTTITKTVKSSGGDYTSRSAWEAGRQGNLPTLDQIEKAEVYAFSDTTACLIDGWTTDATRYWWIFVPLTERHGGKWDGTKARLEYTATAASQSCFRSLEDYGTLEGDQLSITLNGNTGCRLISFNSQTATNNKQIFKQVIGKNISGGTGMQGGVYTLSANTIMVYADCIFYDFDTSSGAYLRDGGASAYFYNCTFHNSSKGIDATGKTDTVTAKNCLFKSCTTAAAGTFAAGTDYNATNNASMGYSVTGAGNTHDRTSQTFTFVDEANDDFHLASSDAGALNFGVDLSADSVYPFSVDIDDQTISGSWSIGADDYVASGVTHTMSAGKLLFVGASPTTINYRTATLSPGVMWFKGYPPTVTTGSAATVTLSKGIFSFVGYAPTFFNRRTISPVVGNYLFKGYSPTVVPGVATTVTLSKGLLNFVGSAPSLYNRRTISPSAGVYYFKGYSPTYTNNKYIVFPSTGKLSFIGGRVSANIAAAQIPSSGLFYFKGFPVTTRAGFWLDITAFAASSEWSAISAISNAWTDITKER